MRVAGLENIIKKVLPAVIRTSQTDFTLCLID